MSGGTRKTPKPQRRFTAQRAHNALVAQSEAIEQNMKGVVPEVVMGYHEMFINPFILGTRRLISRVLKRAIRRADRVEARLDVLEQRTMALASQNAISRRTTAVLERYVATLQLAVFVEGCAVVALIIWLVTR